MLPNIQPRENELNSYSGWRPKRHGLLSPRRARIRARPPVHRVPLLKTATPLAILAAASAKLRY